MMIVVPFLISFLIGHFLLNILLSSDVRLAAFKNPLRLFLALGLGLGITSQICFYSLLIVQQYNGIFAIFLHLALLYILYRKNTRLKDAPNFIELFISRKFLLFVALTFPFMAYLSLRMWHDPYGSWDAWSLWNFRANFILRSGTEWLNLFEHGIQGQHPWLLPFVIAWGWSWVPGEPTLVPITTAFLYSVSTVGVLCFGLREWTGRGIAVLAAVFLFSLPIFLVHSADQYADIINAFYMLTAIVCIFLTRKYASNSLAFLSGLFLGLLSFTKDEGLAAGIIMLILSYFFLRKISLSPFLNLLKGTAVIFVSTVIVKLLMIPSRTDVNVINLSNVLSLNQYQVIIDYILKYIFPDLLWGGLWLVLFIYGLGCFIYRRKDPIRVFLFSFLFYVTVLFGFLYLIIDHMLLWRLNTTLDRLLFQFLPIVILLIFYDLQVWISQNTKNKLEGHDKKN